MARIRTYKPELFKSLDVSSLPLRARWTWLGLWSQCDDHGRYQDVLKLIKAEVWPLDDVSLGDVAEDLETLADHGRIVRYTVGGRDYLAVQNWHHHQSINRPGKPRYPPPPVPMGVPEPGEERHCSHCWEANTELSTREVSLSTHGGLTTGREQGREQGRDARERASPPPDRCPKHQNNPSPPPCGGCRDARKANEQWQAEQPTRNNALTHELQAARADPAYRCEHDVDGGKYPHPDTGQSATCALCRKETP